MIEVEKKFQLSESDVAKLIDGAVFDSRRSFTDVYFDSPDYALTTRDIWLRSRDGYFQLKIPLHHSAERMADQYDELGEEDEIRAALKLPAGTDLESDIAAAGYAPFCTCMTTRRKYKRGSFTIDYDEVKADDFSYNLGEIELLVDEKSKIQRAIDDILALASTMGLKTAPVRGKVIEYLKRKNPGHYRKLVDTGVVKDF